MTRNKSGARNFAPPHVTSIEKKPPVAAIIHLVLLAGLEPMLNRLHHTGIRIGHDT